MIFVTEAEWCRERCNE